MQKYILSILIIVATAFSACEDDTIECCGMPESSADLAGTWQWFEYGYSPGGGYNIVSVPLLPSQGMTFEANGFFTSNIEGFEHYPYYAILDGEQGTKILAFFESVPLGPFTPDIDHLENSFGISFENGNLVISNRRCIEGCHMAFRRIK